MFRISIQDGLPDQWQAVIQRQLDYTLTPIRSSLSSAYIHFGEAVSRRKARTGFICKLTVHDKNGETFQASAQHTDGHTTIAEAFARARRSVSRRRRRKAAA